MHVSLAENLPDDLEIPEGGVVRAFSFFQTPILTHRKPYGFAFYPAHGALLPGELLVVEYLVPGRFEPHVSASLVSPATYGNVPYVQVVQQPALCYRVRTSNWL